MSQRGIRLGKRILAGTILAMALPLAMPRLRAQDAELSKIRSIAAAQHEIVMIRINAKEFAKAAEEANKIFQMKWPADQEPVLLEELLRFSDQFRHNAQPALALRLLETNMSFFKADKSKVAIWKDKGYLLESMGQHDKAIECFKEAIRLEGKPPVKEAPVKKTPVR
jgi:tetratricopeptide (TPR) repeat protein